MIRLFSTEGRLNRGRYFWTSAAISVITGVSVSVLPGVVHPWVGYTAALATIPIILIGGFVMVVFQMIKRLHDLDRPRWHCVLLLAPIYNIYLGLLLLFEEGTEGANRYGRDPLAGKN